MVYVGYLYDEDGETTIGCIRDGCLIIGIYGHFHTYNDSFILKDVEGELCYQFIYNGKCFLHGSEYNTPDINDQESIIALSHILRYKYDVVSDTVFSSRHNDIGQYIITTIMCIKVKVAESSVIYNTWLPKMFYKLFRIYPIIEDNDHRIISSCIIDKFVVAKQTTAKRATNF